MDSRTPAIRNFLLGHLRPHLNWILISAIFGLLLAVTKVWQAQIVKPLLDSGLINKNLGSIVETAVLVVIMIFADGLFSYAHRLSLRTGVERTIIDIKNKLFQRVLIFSQKQLSGLESGKVVTLLFNDTYVITQGLHITSDLIRQPLAIVGLSGYLLYLNWKLTLFCLVAGPLVVVVTKKLGQSSRRNQTRIQIAIDRVSQYSLESIQGLRTAHSFGRLALLKKEFAQKLQAAYKPTIKQASVQEIIAPISKLLFALTGAALLIICGHFVSSGQMTTGEVASFLMAAGLLQDPIRQLNHVHVRLQEVYASAERIVNVLDQDLDAVAEAQKTLLGRDLANGACQMDPLPLRLTNVSFSYTPNSERSPVRALHDISLNLEPGRKLALVGPSGSGKSTLSLMIMRYLDTENGQVLLGAKDARDWSIEEYRSHFSYVSQDVFLFSKSLRENLLFASPKATDEQLWAALDQARIRSFVESLPEGLDTIVQERALNLSGGEKQRLAIARAILRNAPIVILDEATSQLDIENERLIQQALKSLMLGKSVIIIAHRLSTVREVDEVLVLENGRVVERGSPGDLVGQSSSWFSRMWASQGYT